MPSTYIRPTLGSCCCCCSWRCWCWVLRLLFMFTLLLLMLLPLLLRLGRSRRGAARCYRRLPLPLRDPHGERGVSQGPERLHPRERRHGREPGIWPYWQSLQDRVSKPGPWLLLQVEAGGSFRKYHQRRYMPRWGCTSYPLAAPINPFSTIVPFWR